MPINETNHGAEAACGFAKEIALAGVAESTTTPMNTRAQPSLSASVASLTSVLNSFPSGARFLHPEALTYDKNMICYSRHET
jgi:hypothetical protein